MIEYLRNQMHRVAEERGSLTHPDVIALSQRLDQFIVLAQKRSTPCAEYFKPLKLGSASVEAGSTTLNPPQPTRVKRGAFLQHQALDDPTGFVRPSVLGFRYNRQ
nr:aspartyl-phosphate phosphatase Spo0E family protein [Alicyclobacillus sp. ALC3]